MTDLHDTESGDDTDMQSDIDSDRPHKSIGEVLGLLQDEFPDISISKIRFLESRGLVEPHRAPSGYRKFDAVDVDRLRWILTMQRDHFLPLRVIKERLDGGEVPSSDSDSHSEPRTAVASVPKPKSSRFRTPGPTSDDLEPSDLARLAGLTAQQLDQLVQFGLFRRVLFRSALSIGNT